ncbi:translation elongation factor Ts [Candidatus Karelsulcia muelleri]|uniref:Elongation factor Ts n=1 Tax=Candidatus Karelsulcia muelleri PSPU TaxID=1189303 RepID=A0AAD1EXD4_9FLAO|nr:translation elongation factor Ts [Candidatus Karelsulcia muelleri]NJJ98608.1 translation elongation factor Ts [Candidatus Karelsulcia muelleri]BAO66266.1 elongation factor Ts [Candidatus Karelsulcia muelleri PSPU]
MYKPKISEINTLRKITNSGIIDCKKAIIESNGNIEEAIDWLRKKGVSDNIICKETNEGFVICKINKEQTVGVILKINCETDFVTRNSTFINMANIIVNKALYCNNIDELFNIKINKNLSVINFINHHMNNIIKEKIELSSFEIIKSSFVGYYVHHSNKIGSIVGFSKKIKGIEKISKEIAMQIVATNPLVIERNSLPIEIIEREKKIIKNKLLNLKKSKNIINKIIDGKIQKFIFEKVLLDQNFIKNKKISIREYLKNFDKNLKITSYKRIS